MGRKYDSIPDEVKIKMRVLRVREQRSYADIALRMGVSERTARKYAGDKYWMSGRRKNLDYLLKFEIDEDFRKKYPVISRVIRQIQEGRGSWRIGELEVEVGLD